MKNQNWPYGTNMGHPNWTGRTARKYDGLGSFHKDSHDIPMVAWVGAVVVVCVFLGFSFIGAAAGFV